MKKANLTIIATIIAALAFSMFAFQSTATEASTNVSPTAVPTPRKIRKTKALELFFDHYEQGNDIKRKKKQLIKRKQPRAGSDQRRIRKPITK